VQPLPSRQAERQLRKVQPLSAREDKKQVRCVHPLPSRQAEKHVREVQPMSSWEAETGLHDMHPLSARQGEKILCSVQHGTRTCTEFKAGQARAGAFAQDQTRTRGQAGALDQARAVHHPRLLRHRRRGLLVPERKSSRCCTVRRVGRERRDTFFKPRVLQITRQERVLNATNTNYPSSPNSFVNLSCTSRSALATVGRAFNKTFRKSFAVTFGGATKRA